MARFRIPSETIRSFLKEILAPEQHKLISQWVEKASLREVSGVKLLMSICRTQGRKRLRPISRSKKDIDCEFTQSFQSPLKSIDSSRSAVLKLIKTPKIRELFIPSVLEYIRNWTSIAENLPHEGVLVSFFNSFKASQRPFSAPRASEVKDFKTAFELAQPSERKMLILRGNLNVNNFWPVALRSSSYQDAFAERSKDSKINKMFDFKTSVVGKIIPDRKLNYTMLK